LRLPLLLFLGPLPMLLGSNIIRSASAWAPISLCDDSLRSWCHGRARSALHGCCCMLLLGPNCVGQQQACTLNEMGSEDDRDCLCRRGNGSN
jgi:hypothetical protein